MGRAVEAAKLSTQRNRHAALVVKSGNLLSIAVNKYRNTPGMVDPKYASWHAEYCSLRLVSYKSSINSVLYVARYGRNDKICISKPCRACMKYLITRGVKKIVYSTIDGNFAVERV